MLNYFKYLNDRKDIEARLREAKYILDVSKIFDECGEQKVRYEGMSEMTFRIKCRIDVYERWLEKLNKLTFKQRLTYEGTEYLRG